MKNIALLTAFLFIGTMAIAQNIVYDSNVEVRKLGSFNALDVTGSIQIFLSQGNESAIAISTEDGKNYEKIHTNVEGGTLKISIEPGFWNAFDFGNKKIKAYITVKELEKVELNSGCILKSTDEIKVRDLNLIVRSGSIVKLKTNATFIEANIHSGSIAEISGAINKAVLNVQSGSIYKGSATINDCSVKASSGAVVNAVVNKVLNVTASGGSVIKYSGQPGIENIQSDTGSIVKRKN